MFSSLRSRFSVTFAMLLAIVLCMASVIMFLVVRNIPVRTTNIRLQEISRIVINREEFQTINARRQAEALKRIADSNNVRILLVEKNGTILLDTAGIADHLDDLPPAARPKTGDDSFPSGTFRDKNRQLWQYVSGPFNNQLDIILAAPQPRFQSLDFLTDDLLPPLLWVTGFTLLLAILLAGLTARWVSSPLSKIVEATRQVPGGNVARIEERGPDEVKQLARAFNEMNAQVAAGKRAQQDFVANVSHELKTPLTAIQGFAQAISDGTAGTEDEIHQAAGVIYGEAGRMHNLVLDLLDLARIEGGTATFEHEPVDLPALLNNLVIKFNPIARDLQIDLAAHVNEIPLITGDGERLLHVFNNLLDNALKYSPAGSRVSIRSETAGDHVAIHFTDAGPGIPPGELERIFERFYQLDKARTRSKYAGFGLGLAIAQEIVHAHGGEISVTSEMGRGSDFVVKLPLTQQFTANQAQDS